MPDNRKCHVQFFENYIFMLFYAITHRVRKTKYTLSVSDNYIHLINSTMWPPLLSRYFRSLLVQSFQVCFDQMLHEMSTHHNQFTQRSDRAVLRQNIKKFMENVNAKDSRILCITDVSTCQRMNSHYTSYRKRFAKLKWFI